MKAIARLSSLYLFFWVAVFPQPKIEIIGGESMDFGTIFRGEKIERKVKIKNVGTQLLVIERVQPSCGCTATILEEKNVPPGKTTLLSIGFDSKGFSGEVHKSVSVFSNDPRSPGKEIRFKVFVKEALTASPGYIYFMPGRVDSTMTSSTTLKNTSEETINIPSVSANSPDIMLDLKKKSLRPGETTTLVVTYTPSKTGYANHEIVVKTTHPKQPELILRLVCNVVRASTSVLPAGKEGFPTSARKQ